MRAALVPSGPALGAITSAAIADDGSNSGWKVVGVSKESITRTAGGAGVGGGQAAATLRALAASAVNTEIGFETTHGTSHPGSRAAVDAGPGHRGVDDALGLRDRAAVAQQREVRPLRKPAARAQPETRLRRNDVPHRPRDTRRVGAAPRREGEAVGGSQRIQAHEAAAERERAHDGGTVHARIAGEGPAQKDVIAGQPEERDV